MNPKERILTIRLQEKLKENPTLEPCVAWPQLKGENSMPVETTLYPGSIINAVFKGEVGQPPHSERCQVNAVNTTNVTLEADYETYVVAMADLMFVEILESSPLEQATVLANFAKEHGCREFSNKVTGILDSMTENAWKNNLGQCHHELNRKICKLGTAFPQMPEAGLTQLLSASLHILERNAELAQDALAQVQLPEDTLNQLVETMSPLPQKYQNLCQLYWDIPQEPEVEDEIGYEVGTIFSFNATNKYGFIQNGESQHFFHIAQVFQEEAELRFALGNNQWQGLTVSYLFGKNSKGLAATDIRLEGESPALTPFLTGDVKTFNPRKNQGIIEMTDYQYKFSLEDITDPFLSNYYQCGFVQPHQVHFQLVVDEQGKKHPTNVRHTTTVGEKTEVPRVGFISQGTLDAWCRLDAKTEPKDPFATDDFYPLPLYDFSIPESQEDAPYKTWRETPVETESTTLPKLPPFKGTVQELRDAFASVLSLCERRLKHLFAFEFPLVDNYHLSDFQDNNTETLRTIKSLYPEMARLNGSVIETNGKNIQQANPSILNLLSLSFIVTSLQESWATRFARYFRPVGYDWNAALTQIAKYRNIAYHEQFSLIPRAELEEVYQICQAFLHM